MWCVVIDGSASDVARDAGLRVECLWSIGKLDKHNLLAKIEHSA